MKMEEAQAERFIPAHAGNTRLPSIRKLAKEVHPRSRGEYYALCIAKSRIVGSSPLTRGILIISALVACVPRFIPAHAGNTSSTKRKGNGHKVHPRSRGEYTVYTVMLSCNQGSSPLTRGIPCGKSSGRMLRGFIPAHAGNTQCPRGKCLSVRVHPRSRGEYKSVKGSRKTVQGSSPLTRGIRKQCEL